MATTPYDVFISYRREPGSEFAQLVRTNLERRGFRVFLDVREMGAGLFDEALVSRIEEAPDFVLILTPRTLDRCQQEGDWLRREIAHALAVGRNVVPLATPGFAFPEVADLPPDLATLPRHQSILYEHLYSDEAMDRLVKMLRSAKAVQARRTRRRTLGAVAGLLLAVAAWWGASTWLLPASRPSEAQTLQPLALYWHGFGQRLDSGRWAEFNVQDGVTMYSGDQFRLVFSPSADAYAYIVGIDPQQRVSVLFPHEAIGRNNRVRAGERYEVPDGLNWFTLDERAGAETVYLVASYDPIEDFDALITPRATPEPSGALARQVESRIASLDGVDVTGDPVPTRRGQVVRGVEIRADSRVATATLTGGQQVSQTMQFEAGGSRVVKRLLIHHEARH